MWAACDHAPAGRLRALSANVDADATVSSHLMADSPFSPAAGRVPARGTERVSPGRLTKPS